MENIHDGIVHVNIVNILNSLRIVNWFYFDHKSTVKYMKH
jgi:hypothetical protein